MDDLRLALLYQLYEAQHSLLTLADFIDTIEEMEDHAAAATADSGRWVFAKDQ